MAEKIPRVRAQIGLLRRQHTGHLLDILRGLFDEDVHRVVKGHDTDHAPVRVHHGQREKVVFRQHLRDLFLVGQRADGDHVFVHDLAHGGVVVRGEEQILDRHRAEEFPPLGDIAGVDRLLVHARAADTGDRLGHGHARPQRDILRRHDRSGGVFGIAQDLVDLLAHLGVGLGEDTLDHIGRHLVDEIRRIVDVKLVDDLVQLTVGKTADQQLLPFAVQLGKGLGRGLLGQQPEQHRHALLLEILEHAGNVRRLHGHQDVLQGLILLLIEKCTDRLLKLHCHRFLPPSLALYALVQGSPTREKKQAEVQQYSTGEKRPERRFSVRLRHASAPVLLPSSMTFPPSF